MSDPYIVFGAPYLNEEEIAEVTDSLKSGWLGTGPKVRQFEQEFSLALNLNAESLVAVSSCTAALHLSLITSGIGPGDEVITSPLTFAATANAIIYTGATPVLVDIDPTTHTIDCDLIERAITSRTRAIVPIHFAGYPCDMGKILQIAQRYGLSVIEDCAHALETQFNGKQAGSFGDYGCFSFYATKAITTGEGGIVYCKEPSHAQKIKTMSLQGMSLDAWQRFSSSGYKHYQVTELGFKYNMMDVQAAIGLHQLRKMQSFYERRAAIWWHYQLAFAKLPIARPTEIQPDVKHGYHLYTIQVDSERCGINRDQLIEKLHLKGIGAGVHYLPLNRHQYYQEKFGWKPNDTPVAMAVGKTTLSLPLNNGLKQTDLERVTEAVIECLAG